MTKKPADSPRVRLGYGGAPLTGESAAELWSTILRLFGYARPYSRGLLVITGLVAISTTSGLAGPILLGRVVDEVILPRNLEGLVGMVTTMLVLYLIGGLASVIHGVMMVDIGQRLIAYVRAELFNHLQSLAMAYHDAHRVGDLMSRVTNDSEAINQALSNGLIQFVSNILLLIGIMVAMFFLNWQLAIGTLILLPIMLFITARVTQVSRAAFRQVQSHLGSLNAIMQENIVGYREVQAFGRGPQSMAQFEEVNAANRAAGVKADIITAALGPMFTTMSTITIAATAWLGGWLALQGIVSIGVIATFIIYIMNFFRPMRGIAMLYNQLQAALAGAERIFAVLDANSTVPDTSQALDLEEIVGAVQFSGVCFAYEPGVPVLQDFDLEVAPGETIALVGPTGAGKTTVINLLSRFYDVDAGAITIDGVEIRGVTQRSIRRQLGIVLQDTFLFSGTVLDNIRYGRLDATEEEVRQAAVLANADWFIRRLPQGYETLVSEQGHNFSQGQRQLLAIARAILADPRILILDEATSSVDTRTEVQIQRALLHLLEGRTAFVIAHRLSTIRNADQVLVINEGRIIERGTHETLLAEKGFYYQQYSSQYRHLSRERKG